MRRTMFLLVMAGMCLTADPLVAQPGDHGPQPPIFINCPDSIVFRCSDTATYQFLAVNPHSEKPQARIRYRLVSGPGAIDSLTGWWWYYAPNSVPGTAASSITVAAEIRHGQKVLSRTCYAELISTTDAAPSLQFGSGLQCGDTVQILADTEFALFMNIENTSLCAPSTYHLSGVFIDQAPAGSCLYGPDTTRLDCDHCYAMYFQPSSVDVGKMFTFTFAVSNGLDTTTCQLYLDVAAKPITSADYAVRIDVANQAPQGQPVAVPVYLDRADSLVPPGGFDFLIAFDSTVLSIQDITPGELISNCAWEYFTYRAESNNCGGSCPGGLLRVTALADVANGNIHPACYRPDVLPAALFYLNFVVGSTQSTEVQFVPVRFYWLGCTDNSCSSADNTILLVSDSVIDASGSLVSDIDSTLPSLGGISAAMSSCLMQASPRVLRAVDFYDGGVSIQPAVVADAPGDINLNRAPFELADIGMFTNFFKVGMPAFADHADRSTNVSNINGNGTPLEMADFVCAERIAVGGLSLSAVPADTSVNAATIIHLRMLKQIALATNDTLGGIQFIFSGNLGKVTAFQTGFTVDAVYDTAANLTRVLVMTGIDSRTSTLVFNPKVVSGTLFTYTGAGSLAGMTAATKYGKPVKTILQLSAPTGFEATVDNPPTSFSLEQNYPNPFNPSTTISFALPAAGEVRLEIVNILGEVVYSHSERCDAGTHQLVWTGTNSDGQAVASGVYYYRLQAAGQTAVRKMMLLK